MSAKEKDVLKLAKGAQQNGSDLFDNKALESVRRDLNHSRHLPGYFYSDPDIYRMEIEKFFMKDWLVVGRVEEFPNSGDYRAMELAGENIIICRNKNNELNAFSNVCRHRGPQVVFNGDGNKTGFSCPYHGWAYDLDGTLKAASRTKEIKNFDFKNCRLPALKLDTWGGFIFVNFDPGSPSLNEYLDVDRIGEVSEFLKLDDLRLIDTHTFEIDCNWKLLPENLIDVYHVQVLHKDTFGEQFGADDYDFRLTKYGWHAYFDAGTNAPDGELFFGPMPWLADHPRGELMGFTVFVRPHMNLFARQDQVQPWVTYPISPTRSRITIWTMFPEAVKTMKAYEEKAKILHDFIVLASAEDREMLESMQANFTSRRFQPGPLAGLEIAIHHRINGYLDCMLGDGEVR